jgi:hypothetical protein
MPYSSDATGMDVVRLGFILGCLQNLDCTAGDIRNALLYGKTREKVCIIAGLEFADEQKGKCLVVGSLWSYNICRPIA